MHLIDPWISANDVHILSGRSGSGKTTLAFQALNHYYDDLAPILYINFDRNYASWRAKSLFDRIGVPEEKRWECRSIIDHLSKQTDTHLITRIGNKSANWLYTDKEVKAFAARYGTPVKTLVMDGMDIGLPIQDMNRKKEVADALISFSAYCEKYNITAFGLVHNAKERVNTRFVDKRDRMSGSHAFQAYACTKMYLNEEENGLHSMLVIGPDFKDTELWFRRSAGLFMPSSPPSALPSNEVLDAMHEGLTTIAGLCGRTGLSRSTVFRHLTELQKTGLVKQEARGRYSLVTN